jgi:hypothetical protein
VVDLHQRFDSPLRAPAKSTSLSSASIVRKAGAKKTASNKPRVNGASSRIGSKVAEAYSYPSNTNGTGFFERPEMAVAAMQRLSLHPPTPSTSRSSARAQSRASTSGLAATKSMSRSRPFVAVPTPSPPSAKKRAATHPLAEEEEESTQDALGYARVACREKDQDHGDWDEGFDYSALSGSPGVDATAGGSESAWQAAALLEFDDAEPPKRLLSASRSPAPQEGEDPSMRVGVNGRGEDGADRKESQVSGSTGLTYLTPPAQPITKADAKSSDGRAGLQRSNSSLVSKMKGRNASLGSLKEKDKDRRARTSPPSELRPIPRLAPADMLPYVHRQRGETANGKHRQTRAGVADGDDDAPISSIEQFSSPEKPRKQGDVSSSVVAIANGRAHHPFSQVTQENDARLKERGQQLSETRREARREREKARRRTIEELGVLRSSEAEAGAETRAGSVRSDRAELGAGTDADADVTEEENELAQDMERFVDFEGGEDQVEGDRLTRSAHQDGYETQDENSENEDEMVIALSLEDSRRSKHDHDEDAEEQVRSFACHHVMVLHLT